MAEDTQYKLVIDRPTLRPACVLLQAAYGGDHGIVSRFFDSDLWHVTPATMEDPVGVTATMAEWKNIAGMAREIQDGKLPRNEPDATSPPSAGTAAEG